MAFVSINDELSRQPTKELPTPFLSVNKATGGYLGGGLYTLLGKPDFLEIEYDADVRILRVRPGKAGDSQIKNQGFRLPEDVRHTMSKKKSTYYKNTTRWSVVERDGWWYTDGVQ